MNALVIETKSIFNWCSMRSWVKSDLQIDCYQLINNTSLRKETANCLLQALILLWEIPWFVVTRRVIHCLSLGKQFENGHQNKISQRRRWFIAFGVQILHERNSNMYLHDVLLYNSNAAADYEMYPKEIQAFWWPGDRPSIDNRFYKHYCVASVRGVN